MNIPDNVKAKKYIALFTTNTIYLGNDGKQYPGKYLVGGDDKDKLLNCIEDISQDAFDRGFLWKSEDWDNGLPDYVIMRKIDEDRNLVLSSLEYVLYDDMYRYEAYTPKDVLDFQEEAERSTLRIRIDE